jgi:dipeptide/tripeptide permease
MSSKTMIYTGLFIGSTIGGFIPTLWGDSAFSISAVLLSAVGGIAGIVVGFKISSE